MNLNIKWRGNEHTNYSSRKGHKPQIIVNHITASHKASADSWFRSSGNSQSSCHFMVNKDGSIYQYVDMDDNAWCNGLKSTTMNRATSPFLKDFWKQNGFVNPNRISVSIEHEALASDTQLTDKQYQATLQLHIYIIEYIREKYGRFEIDRQHIIGHKEIDKVNKPFCPMKDFPFDKLISDIKEYFNMKESTIPEWARQLGLDSIKSLGEKDLLSSPEVWLEKDLGENVPLWLFFTMIDRVSNK